MAKARILIVDDEESTRELFAELLQRWGYEVDQTADGHGALKIAAETHPDVIISDLVMPKLDGLALVRALREEQPDTPVVIITGKGTIDAAVEAVREGVFDFVEKPLDPARLRVILQRALEKKETLHEMQVLRRRLGQVDSGVGLVGNSPPMRRAMELVEKVAPSKASVVITGQSGTGKEMVARAIHQLSPRRDKPFIAINCSAIPATLIESEMFGHERGAFTGAEQRRLGAWELADGGTLFLDEVGEIPIELQAKFLRVLEEERLRRLAGKHPRAAQHPRARGDPLRQRRHRGRASSQRARCRRGRERISQAPLRVAAARDREGVHPRDADALAEQQGTDRAGARHQREDALQQAVPVLGTGSGARRRFGRRRRDQRAAGNQGHRYRVRRLNEAPARPRPGLAPSA